MGSSLKRPKWRSILSSFLIYGLSLACLVWVFTGIQWRELAQQLRHADMRWIATAVLLEFVSDTYHAWRWNLLLRPVARLRLGRTLRALYVGLFANEVLPLRPGELVRSYLLAEWNLLGFPVVVSSVALERLLDGFSLAMTFSVVALFVSLPSYLVEGVRVLAVFLAAAALLLLLLTWRMRGGARPVPRRTGLAGKLHRALEGVGRMANARTLGACAGASVAQLALQGLPYWSLNKSCRLELSIWAVIAVLIVVRAATLIPNAPGNAGVLQIACVLALGLFGVSKTRAALFAAMVFLAINLPLIGAGALVAAFSGVSVRQLRWRTKELEQAES
jgi:glycosyltransferase 2 family protein